jgi:hypothetical protein
MIYSVSSSILEVASSIKIIGVVLKMALAIEISYFSPWLRFSPKSCISAYFPFLRVSKFYKEV